MNAHKLIWFVEGVVAVLALLGVLVSPTAAFLGFVLAYSASQVIA